VCSASPVLLQIKYVVSSCLTCQLLWLPSLFLLCSHSYNLGIASVKGIRMFRQVRVVP